MTESAPIAFGAPVNARRDGIEAYDKQRRAGSRSGQQSKKAGGGSQSGTRRERSKSGETGTRAPAEAVMAVMVKVYIALR